MALLWYICGRRGSLTHDILLLPEREYLKLQALAVPSNT